MCQRTLRSLMRIQVFAFPLRAFCQVSWNNKKCFEILNPSTLFFWSAYKHRILLERLEEDLGFDVGICHVSKIKRSWFLGSFKEQQKEALMRVITCHLKYVFLIYISALHVNVCTWINLREMFTLGLSWIIVAIIYEKILF